MTEIRHIGIYVNDIQRMAEFYKAAFGMRPICEGIIQQDSLIEELVGEKKAAVKITKLITDRGAETGTGDMLELIEVVRPVHEDKVDAFSDRVCKIGCSHIGFGVDNIQKTINLIRLNGGSVKTNTAEFPNGRKCCFCTDPEGNWLELIS